MVSFLVQPVLSPAGIGVTGGVLVLVVNAWIAVVAAWYDCLRR
jgi:hypothetical protein